MSATTYLPCHLPHTARQTDRISDFRRRYPCSETTEHILDTLKKHNVKATFFCVGRNVIQNYNLFNRIIDEGHQVGNHTMNHTDAWKQSKDELLESVTEAAIHIQSRLFRPPHGHLTPLQARHLRKRGYRTVLWDVICYDWDKQLNPDRIIRTVQQYTRNGSIILLHDSVKAAPRTLPALDSIISWLKSEGYEFGLL